MRGQLFMLCVSRQEINALRLKKFPFLLYNDSLSTPEMVSLNRDTFFEANLDPTDTAQYKRHIKQHLEGHKKVHLQFSGITLPLSVFPQGPANKVIMMQCQ